MNFEEEQKFLKQVASELLLFVHQRQEAFHIRSLSGQLDVSSENVNRILELYDMLGIDKIGASQKLEQSLKKCVAICQEERQLKGSEVENYYKSLQTVTNRNCQQCGKPIENSNRKAIFCSNSCRVAHHRSKVADGSSVATA